MVRGRGLNIVQLDVLVVWTTATACCFGWRVVWLGSGTTPIPEGNSDLISIFCWNHEITSAPARGFMVFQAISFLLATTPLFVWYTAAWIFSMKDFLSEKESKGIKALILVVTNAIVLFLEAVALFFEGVVRFFEAVVPFLHSGRSPEWLGERTSLWGLATFFIVLCWNIFLIVSIEHTWRAAKLTPESSWKAPSQLPAIITGSVSLASAIANFFRRSAPAEVHPPALQIIVVQQAGIELPTRARRPRSLP